MSYEWVRPRTVRLTWWLAAVSVAATALAACAYSAVILGMVKSGAAVDGLEAVVLVGSKASFAPVVAAVLGVFAVGNDYRYGTMCTTLLVTPRRGVALAAKAATVAAFGAALAVVAGEAGLDVDDRVRLEAVRLLHQRVDQLVDLRPSHRHQHAVGDDDPLHLERQTRRCGKG